MYKIKYILYKNKLKNLFNVNKNIDYISYI